MIDVKDWKEFRIDEVFLVTGGFYNKKPEHSCDGNIPFLAATDSNNGVTEYYSLQDIREWNKVGEPDNTLEKKIFKAPAIAVTVNGACCSAFFQEVDYTCSHDITSLIPRDGHELSVAEGLFCCTIIEQEKYRWSYGRKPHDVKKLSSMTIKLPADSFGNPDWKYMENYMNQLSIMPITTGRRSDGMFAFADTKEWDEFYLKQLYTVRMGNKFDMNKMTDYESEVNFVSRISFNNGVVGKVDRVTGVSPFVPGLITVALGGSYLGSAFVQFEPFYTAQNVAVLQPKYKEMNLYVNLFITSLIRYEARSKYCAFGRELNVHINRDFSVRLPVDGTGSPDWEWIVSFMRSLPYSDRIEI